MQNVNFYQVSTDNFGEKDMSVFVDFPEKSGIVYMHMLTVLTYRQGIKMNCPNCIILRWTYE